MIIFFSILAAILMFAVGFGIAAAVTAWGIVPLVGAFGFDLPFWPTLIVLTVIASIISARTMK